MEIVSAFVAKIAEYTVEPIVRPVTYLFSYKDNFSMLEKRVEDLTVDKDSICQLVEAEREKGKIILGNVLRWLEKADAIAEDAKKLCGDPHRGKVRCSKWSCPNLYWRQQLSRKAEKMAKEVAEVQSEGKIGFGPIGYFPPLRGVGSISSTRHYVKFESRMSKINDIMRALADHNISKVGVYGLGGVGKSTLVKQVAVEVKDGKLFDRVVLAHVGENPDFKEIQREIADQLAPQLPEKSVRGRSLRLHERIKMEKSILIILDNLWEKIELREVGIPDTPNMNMEKEGTISLNGHTVCKVLLTSRNQEVLNKMGTQRCFRLEVLSAEEAWRLLEVKACDAVKNPALQQTATEVATKCAGLPVLITTLASGLNNKDIHAWKDALNELERVENGNLQEITYSALELSYKYLGNDEIRALFLLCGVMGPYIQVEYLLKCVVGLGIFKCIRTIEDARNRLCKMIGCLRASCLLLECDTDEEVKMHDSIHRAAVSIASGDQLICMNKRDTELRKWPSKECTKVILDRCHIHELCERLDCPELQLFYLYNGGNNLVIPDPFFEGMRNLNMLDLTCVDLSSLPESFVSLINLKTLCLDQCALGDMAAIATLKNIEILSLYHSSMTKLPSEIGQLTNLKMLDLSYSEIKIIPPNIISSLTKLEELYMGNSFIDWEVDDLMRKNKNASLAELRQLPKLTALNFQIQDSRTLPRDLMLEKLERYKIFIGDVWEWVGNYKTSKVLKLKLCTNIRWEHGIKSLIKRVEELYLDQICGISNVLYQLNTEGFPQLKHLRIQNNARIQHLVDSLEWNHAYDSFPNLETLVLHNLHNLEMICRGPLAVNSFKELRVIKVESCYQLIYLFTYPMIKGCSQLLEIDVSNCNSMKNIVLVESGTVVGNGMTTDKIEFCQLRALTLRNLPALNSFRSDGSPTYTSLPFLSTKVAFPNLETLKLSLISSSKLWDDDQLLVDYCIQNLTNLIIEDCGNLKYLFSSSMVGSLLNLKRLEISKCHMMEEIIETNNGAVLDEVRFSKLETIIINDMQNLKRIWHYQFERLRAMEVKNCENIVIVFPAYMQRNFHNLETLMVSNCGSVKEIFELDANETCSEEKMAQLKKLTLLHLPKLKQIWSRDPRGVLCYDNLQVVHVEECQNLEYLFPLSLAERLWQLKEIIIKQAKRMTDIVANQEGAMDGRAPFVFNRLTSLVLWNLRKLERFYAGNRALACPSLQELFVFNCPRLNIFNTQSTRNQGTTSGDNHNVSTERSLFIAEEIIPNLEKLTVNSKDASILLQGQFFGYLFTKLKLLRLYDFEEEEARFPTQFLQNVPSLEWLIVDYSSFKEIFEDERFPSEEGHRKISTRLKSLTLFELHGLKHICKEGFKIDPMLEVLEYLIVKQCSELIYLVPSSNSFSHLTYLELENCNKLVYLITSPTARSLVKLKEMKIKGCNALEEIVTEKGTEAENNISFSSLKTLELNCLPQISRFCSSKSCIKFQMLEEVVVRHCPRMQVFSEGDTSTPSLRKVQIDDQERCWKGSLNGTIKQLFVEKVAFHSIQRLNLFEYPELKTLWYEKLQPKIFSNLKHLVVQKCNFLSDVLFRSNLLEVLHKLEELEVRDCDSLEAVFDMQGVNANQVLVKETTRLKKLTLTNVPNLKHIWKNSCNEILSFENLCLVNVVKCRSLMNLFSVSLSQNLRQLEELNIQSCDVEEIVAMDEGSEEHCFDFPQLTVLRLWSLAKVKSFYPGRHAINCPSLKVLSIYHCEELRIFDFDYSNLHPLHQLGGVRATQKALFSIEKVFPNLELLTLNEKDAMTIWNGNHPSSLFDKVDFLSLQCFRQTPANFPNDFLQSFVNLATLQVRCSSFEVLFSLQECGRNSTAIYMRIRNLRLYNLDKLKYIWHLNTQQDVLDLKLEDLIIMGCSSLANLVPSSMAFKNLINLSVSDCNGLNYLITFSTAETLLQLTTLNIEHCEVMEDVIHTEEEAEGEIIFNNLEYLRLTSLSSLKCFSRGKQALKFPSLVSLIVEGCPEMKIFSPGTIEAPILRALEVENKKKHWKGDLNATIKHCL